ncbi:MAG: hypothetical protein ACOC56_02840 [Atribacterota bacterium]
MSSWKSLSLAIIIFLLLPLSLNLLTTGLIDINEYYENNPDLSNNILSSAADLVENGISINLGSVFGFAVEGSINPFDLIGESAKNFIVDSIVILGVIPDIILIPLVTIGLIALIHAIVKLLPTT